MLKTAELTKKIRAAFEKDTRINLHRFPIERMKQMAERDAWCVIGVKSVVNRIEVRW